MTARRLPRSLDDLRGLRAARWIRESTAGQYDNFGPDAQREQQDRAIERYGLVDTGIEWLVAHSGYRKGRSGVAAIASTEQWTQMMAAAGERYDVLVVGYVSRFARDAEVQMTSRRLLHAAGAALLFVNERILTSDEDSWDAWAREAVEAESYSRRLGRNIRDGYAAKFRRHADQGGNAPLGFRRAGPSRTLEVDPEAIGEVVAIFRRYALGTVSLADLAAETGRRIGQLAEILRNPVYNGWVARQGEQQAAAWRSSPPVDDVLWGRVATVRSRKAWHGGGKRRTADPDPLRGLLYCACGATIQAWGTGRDGQPRRGHPRDLPCARWGSQRLHRTATWLAPIWAQLEGVRFDDGLLAAVVAETRAPATEPATDTRQADRERRELALDHAAGRLTDAAYLAAVARLRERAPVAAVVPAAPSAAEVREHWTNLADTIHRRMTDAERADLLAAIYARVEVAGRTFVRVKLTPEAERFGLAEALPTSVRVSGPGEPGRSRADAAHPLISVRIPIVGRGEWRRARIRSA